DAAHRIFGRQHARGAQFVGNAPEVEMLDRALGQVLPLGDALRLEAALHQCAVDAALAELDRERDADRASGDDDDLMPFGHALFWWGLQRFAGYCRINRIGSALSGRRCQVLVSFSSKRQVCPRADCKTRSPLVMRQDVGPNRVTTASQPGLTL